MPQPVLFFFDIPLVDRVPGFPYDFPTSLFPFWGSYTFLDFALSNTGIYLDKATIRLFSRRDRHKQLTSHLEKWHNSGVSLEDVDIEDVGIDEKSFVKALDSLKEEYIILYKTSSLFFFDTTKDFKKEVAFENDITKFSVEEVPVDFYVCTVNALKKIIHEYSPSLPSKGMFAEHLFSHILHAAFDTIIDAPGKVLFQNNLMQLYESNLSIVSDETRRKIPKSFAMLPASPQKDSIISGNGCVKNSYFAAGTRIDGYVENSIIFEGVHIRENSRVINSVIMNNNQIGKNSEILKTILFPNFNETIGSLTVGEKAKIGSNSSKASNRDYPKQINSGLTVIGSNPTIPDNAVIEPACFIASDVPASVIKRTKVVRKSTSLYNPHR